MTNSVYLLLSLTHPYAFLLEIILKIMNIVFETIINAKNEGNEKGQYLNAL